MNIHKSQLSKSTEPANSSERIDTEGLDDLFRWATNMVGSDSDLQSKSGPRFSRQVLELVQNVRRQEVERQAQEEIVYLQRRTMALLQKLGEKAEEISSLKQVITAQCYALQDMFVLEEEVQRLQAIDSQVQFYKNEQQDLLAALSKVKRERDILDELLGINEQENDRLIELLKQERAETTRLKARRWWHMFWPPSTC